MGFCCPVCGGELAFREHAAVCGAGHSYDLARQGYVHLLPPNQMHAKIPGDSREMVQSRRSFLEKGYYGVFRDTLLELVREGLGGVPHPTLLDAGCGEGYYTSVLPGVSPDAEVYGFDISKFAVKAGAGKYKGIRFAVASAFSIPMADGSCHCLTDVFAPIAEAEFLRVVRPGGLLVLAVPGERHLYGLKEILYDEPYENEHRETDYPGFSFWKRVPVRDEIRVPDAETAMELFQMTPYYWKTGVEGGKRLLETTGFSTEIAFDFILYRRK